MAAHKETQLIFRSCRDIERRAHWLWLKSERVIQWRSQGSTTPWSLGLDFVVRTKSFCAIINEWLPTWIGLTMQCDILFDFFIFVPSNFFSFLIRSVFFWFAFDVGNFFFHSPCSRLISIVCSLFQQNYIKSIHLKRNHFVQYFSWCFSFHFDARI